MGKNLNQLHIYIIEEDFFRSMFLKEKILASNQVVKVHCLEPTELRQSISEGMITDVNDLFLFSLDVLPGGIAFKYAKYLRENCKRCQIAFFGSVITQVDLININGLSVLGFIELKEESIYPLTFLLSEASQIKKVFLSLKETISFELKKEKIILDCQTINYFETVKNERNRIKVFFMDDQEYIAISLKSIKESALPKYYACFKSLVINTNEIRTIDRTNNIIYFNNQTRLAVGYKIRKVLDDRMKQIE